MKAILMAAFDSHRLLTAVAYTDDIMDFSTSTIHFPFPKGVFVFCFKSLQTGCYSIRLQCRF